jgi:hypothetical protein
MLVSTINAPLLTEPIEFAVPKPWSRYPRDSEYKEASMAACVSHGSTAAAVESILVVAATAQMGTNLPEGAAVEV